MSAAQRYAHAAYKDGLDSATIRDLASLATWGRNMQNVERDLHRWTQGVSADGLKTHSLTIETFNTEEAKVEMLEIPCLLPSDVLHAIWTSQNSNLWEVCVGASASKCDTYWAHAAADWAAQHPTVQSVDNI